MRTNRRDLRVVLLTVIAVLVAAFAAASWPGAASTAQERAQIAFMTGSVGSAAVVWPP